MAIQAEIARARLSGQPIRVHTADGEVVVARVLSVDERELVYAVLTSSRPERYAVCDSTGFTLPLEAIERVQALREPPRTGQRRRHRGPASRAPDVRDKSARPGPGSR
jgi:hypothetical protein